MKTKLRERACIPKERDFEVDSVNTVIWIIASALFRALKVAGRELSQIANYNLIAKLDCCSHQLSFLGLTTRFENPRISKNKIIKPYSRLKAAVQSAFKLVKLSAYSKSLKTELIIRFNSVYQSNPPLLLFSNALWKGIVFCMTNKTPRSELDIVQDIGSMI